MAKRAVVAVLALALGFVVAGVGTRMIDSQKSSPYAGGTTLGLFDPQEPLGPDGYEMDLDSALNASPIPLFRPDTPAASDSSLVGIWVRTAWAPEVFIRYASGVEVSVRRADFADGFESFYSHEIEQGYPGQLVERRGLSVFVTPGNSGAGASADLVLNSMHVQIVGKSGQTEEEVLALADSIIDRYRTGS